jgi:hypothetical protein
MTTQELINSRNAAGVAYADAVANFIKRRIELGAHDVALANGHSGYGEVVPTFSGVELSGAALIHGQFCPHITHDWHAMYMQGAELLLKHFDR